MATSLLQVRVEDSLKDQASLVFEGLGIDTSTAVRIFLKRVVMENGIPFPMTIPKAPYNAERGIGAMIKLNEAAEKKGVSNMTLDEINKEINATREERSTKSK